MTTTTQRDIERELFEAAARKKNYNLCRNSMNREDYAFPAASGAWFAWQARAAQATAEPVDPANKYCRWPMCESETVQQQIAEEVAESIFGIVAPDRAPSADSAAADDKLREADATRLVCLEAAQKLRTYVGIYPGDKQARRLIDELSNIAALAGAA